MKKCSILFTILVLTAALLTGCRNPNTAPTELPPTVGPTIMPSTAPTTMPTTMPTTLPTTEATMDSTENGSTDGAGAESGATEDTGNAQHLSGLHAGLIQAVGKGYGKGIHGKADAK